MGHVKSPEDWRPYEDPVMPVDYDDDTVLAVRALEKGTANPGQQQLVMQWLKYACAADDWAYRKDTRATDIFLGRQFIWQQFQKLLHPALTPKDKRAVAEQHVRDAKVQRPAPLVRPTTRKTRATA